MMQSQLEKDLQTLLDDYQGQFGVAKLERPLSFEYYLQWIDEGMHGDMDFLLQHIPSKENPSQLMAEAKSALVFRFPYFPHPKPVDLGFQSDVQTIKIASYAQGEDYHYWLKTKLQEIILRLKTKWPQESFACFTDSAPVLERDLAYRAGLGWVGKNTCLIDRAEGSLFFLGEIYTSLDFESNREYAANRCGKCTRCIDACPTQALSEKKLDARKCISYWTIESKEIAPENLREKFGSWYFGCDICQLVCPWNEKKHGKNLLQDLLKEDELSDKSRREKLVNDLRELLMSSNKKIQKRFLGTALNRASGNAHKRNALLLAINHKLQELVPSIEELQKSTQNTELMDLCEYSLERLRSF